MVVANTLLPSTDEQQVTYHEPRIEPMAIISPQGFSMLDLLLMPEGATDRLTSIFSDRAVTLASHHFPVVATIACREEESNFRSHKRKVLDWSSLRNQQYRSGFVREVQSLHLPTGAETGHWDDACQRIQSAAERLLPAMKRRPNKPWISEGTLVLIDRKRDARTEGDWTAEKSLNKLVKQSAKKDRAAWLDKLARSGEWQAMKNIRGGTRRQQGRLQKLVRPSCQLRNACGDAG